MPARACSHRRRGFTGLAWWRGAGGLAVGLWLAGAIGAPGESPVLPFSASTVRSVSGQFIVLNRQQPYGAPDLSKDPRLIALDPSLLTVMGERVKQALAEELGPGGQWRGKVYLTLRAARSADEEIAFLAERFRDSWVYRLELPNPVERTRLVRALVQAVLLEQANRGAGDRSAEIPLWLSEGLLRHVLATRGVEVILPPPQVRVGASLTVNPVMLDSRRTNAVTLACLALGERGPMTLAELSWPPDNVLAGPDAERYQLSAQILVAELLRLADGRDCLRRMLAELPNYLNWQLAFRAGFQAHFPRQLDFEKWWALQTEFLTGRTVTGAWSATESWQKLDQVLRVPVQVQPPAAEAPRVADVALGTVIVEWDTARQTAALRRKLTELHALRLRVAAEFLPLVDAYHAVLTDYLNRRERPASSPGSHLSRSEGRRLVRGVLQQLEELEARRQELKPATPAPVAAAPPAGP